MEFDVQKRTILYIRAGSHSYGTNIEGSDEDFKGVAIAPLLYYLGPFKKFEQSEKYKSRGADKDETIFNVQKFIALAANANPNVVECLFVHPDDILYCDDFGRKLIESRDLFITKKIRHTLSGYAFSQIQRIKTHRSWLLNPPSHKPTREEFGLSTVAKITPSEMGAYEHVLSKGEILPENIMVILNLEKKYAQAKRHWDQYENWKATRNKERAPLEAAYGYDCKHAYHVVRLARMGLEILNGEGMKTRRPDAEELIAIRQGAWTYDQLIEWFEEQEKKVEIAYQNSKLPFGPDHTKLDKLCMDLILEFNSKVGD